MDADFKVMTDCFAYDNKRNNCKSLKNLYCKLEGRCPFYKTKGSDEKRLKRFAYEYDYDKTRTSSSGTRFH